MISPNQIHSNRIFMLPIINIKPSLLSIVSNSNVIGGIETFIHLQAKPLISGLTTINYCTQCNLHIFKKNVGLVYLNNSYGHGNLNNCINLFCSHVSNFDLDSMNVEVLNSLHDYSMQGRL